MSERSSTHLALVVSVLAILVAIFAEFRGHDQMTAERLARLETRVDALHESCCEELNYAGPKSEERKQK